MITRVDALLDRVTMYRLVLFVLVGFIALALVLSSLALLPFAPIMLLASTTFLAVMCWAANALLASILAVPTNVESTYITALILALIIDPAKAPGDLLFLGWAAILAISSKYILSLSNKHVFNPAAIAVVITSFALGQAASWWVGTFCMLPGVLLGGVLVVRKVRNTEMVVFFLVAALVTVCVVSLWQGLPLLKEVQQLLVVSPLFFFATIMLTEPLTAPPTRNLKCIYGVIVGILCIPQLHVGSLYSTPELALIIGNIYSYIVSPKRKVLLNLKSKRKIATDMTEFVFRPSHRFTFQPGQYMEFTLAHDRPDSRGNRRFFTLASSPTEPDLRLGVRFYTNGSSFKRALSGINNSTKLLAGQVAGDFTLPADPKQKLVFIAGGIGITPFRSMLKYLLDTQEPRDIVLLYSNRNANEIAYQDILRDSEKQLGIKVLYTLTNIQALPKNWSGLSGRIDEQMIKDMIPDYQERVYYVSGPPDMVKSCEQILKNLHVKGNQVKKDFFPGLV